MQALILAAGEGKRFNPIVTHKPFLPFCGKTLLEWIIADLKKINIQKFIIVTNPEDAKKITYPTVIQSKPTGMAEAVLTARSLLAGPTVIVNGDDLIDPKILQEFKQAIDRQPKKICLTAINSDLPGGYFDLQESTLKVIEKPTNKPSHWLKLVLDYFPKMEEFITALESIKSEKDDVYEQAINKLKNVHLVKTSGYFQSLKYPWQILDMTQVFLTQRGQVKIDKTAKIMAGASVINSYIGPHVVLGQHALVRDSIIESGTVVGYHTEVCRSYVGPNNNFHTNYVGDSVIEAGSNLGSGARLANMRFDKKEVMPGRPKLGAAMARGSQLGINVSVMPGVTLGEKAIVGSGLVLTKSLEAGEFKKA